CLSRPESQWFLLTWRPVASRAPSIALGGVRRAGLSVFLLGARRAHAWSGLARRQPHIARAHSQSWWRLLGVFRYRVAARVGDLDGSRRYVRRHGDGLVSLRRRESAGRRRPAA